ncbi:hypothetical protein [uncultured Aureimonas sp.]|uniref:hypothetical protein n=1 Tax=uncultured Aureimonas sp. TaxID=1604662 RepID=UPI0025D5E328|nr:hypothetical protein [uncultured Aureimonas sp.]
MENRTASTHTSEFSMRRTMLTLLGAVFAFGILTASYATAELPATAAVDIQQDVTAR